VASPASEGARSIVPRRIRAVRLHEFGSGPVVDELPAPGRPGPGEVVIDVSAAGIGAWDLGVRDGRLARFVPDELPFTMGAELAGRVREVGADVGGLAPGDRVVANPGIAGAWADVVRVPAFACGRAPVTLDDEEAATLPVRALTAWQALERLDLPRGATLFVCGGGGGVGRAAIELAKGRGLRVLTIAGADELDRLLRLGADDAADHRAGWRRGLAASAPEGVDGVLDLVGGDSLEGALGMLRQGGRAVTTVSNGRRMARDDVTVEFLAMKSRTEDLDVLADVVERGELSADVAARYPIEDAAAALDAAMSLNPADGDILLRL
jgi:NADPH:quinone reductase-like Zn-dependent oxidoreductase